MNNCSKTDNQWPPLTGRRCARAWWCFGCMCSWQIGRTWTKEISPYKKLMNDRCSWHYIIAWMAELMDWMWLFVMNHHWWDLLGLFFSKCSSSFFLGPLVHLGKQLIFGQLLATPGCSLHPLHWVEVMGTANGTPRHLEAWQVGSFEDVIGSWW